MGEVVTLDDGGALAHWLAARYAGVVLVRPDHDVFGTGAPAAQKVSHDHAWIRTDHHHRSMIGVSGVSDQGFAALRTAEEKFRFRREWQPVHINLPVGA